MRPFRWITGLIALGLSAAGIPLPRGASVTTTPKRGTLRPLIPAAPREMHSVEKLIDRLQQQSDWLSSVHTVGGDHGLPSPNESRPGKRATHPSVPDQLVRRGLPALPALIAHLTDARPTKLIVRDTFGISFGDRYESRYRDPRRQPPGVNRLDPDAMRNPASEHRIKAPKYALKVGDLCYVVIGRIVNRSLSAGGTMSTTINSPVQNPALARAVESDWKGLTPEEHARSLYEDALYQTDPFGETEAIGRLLYYYPSTGRALALKFLERPLHDSSVIYTFMDRELVGTAPVEWSSRLERFRTAHGEATYHGLQRELIYGSAFYAMRTDADAINQREVYDAILARFFPGTGPQQPIFLNTVGYDYQERLVRELSNHHWPGLDAAILRVFQGAAAARPETVRGRYERDVLALTCAERLTMNGHDELLRKFFQRCVREAKSDLRVADEYRPARGEQIGELQRFLKRLSSGRSIRQRK